MFILRGRVDGSGEGERADDRPDDAAPGVSAIGFAAIAGVRRAPPVTVAATLVRLPDWVEAHGGYADPPPPSPVALADAKPETASLIPYGAAKLRVTALPVSRA